MNNITVREFRGRKFLSTSKNKPAIESIANIDEVAEEDPEKASSASGVADLLECRVLLA